MITETWQGLLERLDHVLAFATELQLDPGPSRFTSYRLRLARLERTRVEKGDDAAFEQFRAEPDLTAVAFSESQELGMIVPFLRLLPPAIAKKKLQLVLKGPELASEEDSNSSLARSTWPVAFTGRASQSR
jgi:hypothetical protein